MGPKDRIGQRMVNTACGRSFRSRGNAFVGIGQPFVAAPMKSPVPLARTRNMRKQNGFTLTELLIVAVIAGILAALAAPQMRVFLQNNARATRINTLVTAFNYARSEAIRLGSTVTVCPSANLTQCANANTFHTGWIVFSNLDADGVHPATPPTVDAGEAILRVFQLDIDVGGGTTFLGGDPNPATTPVKYVTYDARGFPDSSLSVGNYRFIYCDGRGVSQSRAVVLSNTGHPRLFDNTAALTCP